MSTADMTTKGQITAPADVRADLRLQAGDRVSFEKAEDGSYRISPVRGDIMRLAGSVKYDGPPVSIEDMNRAIGEAVAERFRRATAR